MSDYLPVVETFHSIQGEGAHTGRSAFFIRLASCNVGCTWCDTKHSWSAHKYPKIHVKALANKATEAVLQGAEIIIITGGEPLHHDLNPLCTALNKHAKSQLGIIMPIHLETSGVDSLSGSPTWITLSPKRHSPPLTELLTSCQELKVIIHEIADLDFAELMAEKAMATHKKKIHIKSSNNNTQEPLLFLQPGWENKQGHKIVVEYVLHNPKWRLSIQSHKLLSMR